MPTKSKTSPLAAVLFLACSCLPLPALGQVAVLPTTGKSLGGATAPEPGKWIVFAAGLMPVQPVLLDSGKAIIWEGPAGDYAVIYLPPGDGQPIVQRVTLGGNPGPEPQPDPTPPPGNRWAVIWEESAQRTPAQAALRNALAKSPPKQKLLWLDVSNLPEAWKPYQAFVADKPLPVLAVYVGRQLVRAVPLPSSAEAVKQEIGR